MHLNWCTFGGTFPHLANSKIAVVSSTSTAPYYADQIECDNSSNITLSLYPANLMRGRVLTIKKTGNNANTITIDPDGSDSIDGASTIVLYVRYDSITIYSNGTNWQIVTDARFKHSCKINRAASQPNITHATVHPIQMDTTILDTGGLAELGSYGIRIKRAGTYLIASTIRFQGMGDTTQVQTRMNNNGAIFALNIAYSPAAAAIVYAKDLTTESLAANDLMTFSTYQTSGGTLATDAQSVHGLDATPQLLVTEL